MHKHNNNLIHETSPYLLQHAHNPVNWFPWGEEALRKAREENKPILVSIGYAACHWCHVMERESFEDESTANIMNENFINIKIDREERPDLDHIYMDAVQAMTGGGGWPLNVFLTPDKKPFYGGTYFPPQRAYNRPSWQETLYSVLQAFRERRHEIDAQAENLTSHLMQANSFGADKKNGENIFSTDQIDDAFQNIMKSADREWGGFGKPPKFPQTFSIQYLLQYYYYSGEDDALKQSLLSLDKMIEGGIYDQLGGGFARYSTDEKWLAPHFEKMLYDNALLIIVLSEAYQVTKKVRYKNIIDQTISFIQRELLAPGSGFYSALDADSEGIEGKFYTWHIHEVKQLLGDDATIFCDYYDISEHGNWEHTNILHLKKSLDEFVAEKKMDKEELIKILERGEKILLHHRSQRVRPMLDDKIILGWNALMNTACSKAYAATGNKTYLKLAIENMNFLLSKFSKDGSGEFYHTWKNDVAKFPAFLDDYSFLIQALINLQEVSAENDWLLKAKSIISFVVKNFSDTESSFFFYTKSGQEDIILRKIEVYDGALPSGNSTMANNLLHLSLLLDNKVWKERAIAMLNSLGKAIAQYPTSFGNWACLLLEIIKGTNEIAILGQNSKDILVELLQNYIPHRVIMASEKPDFNYPLLARKPITISSSLFLCRDYTCQSPVFSVNELISLINRGSEG